MTQAEAMDEWQGRHLLIYFLYHPEGLVEDYVCDVLAGLRPHVGRLHVVTNGALAPGQAARLVGADAVLERANEGFDAAAYAEAIAALPEGALKGLSALSLVNHTFFAAGDFGPLFEWGAAQEADFWGASRHGALTPDPFTGEGTLPAHLNSHWITIRQPMLGDPAFAAYWRGLPPIASYEDSVRLHEVRFTAHFEALGYRSAAKLEPGDDTPYPAFFAAHRHVGEGFPLLKRRLFFHQPIAALDAHGGNPRGALAAVPAEARGAIWRSVAKLADPWTLYANADLLFLSPVAGRAAAGAVPVCVTGGAMPDLPFETVACTDPAALPPDQPVLIVDAGVPEARRERGLAHIARSAGQVAHLRALFAGNPGFGLALPPIRADGLESDAEAPPGPDGPALRSDCGVAWVRAGIAAEILPLLGDAEAPARKAAALGMVTIVLSNIQTFPRHAVKLEARYRALAGQLGLSGPFAPPARLAQMLERGAAAAERRKADLEAAHEAGWRAGFTAGFDDGYGHGFRDGFDDGYHNGRGAAAQGPARGAARLLRRIGKR